MEVLSKDTKEVVKAQVRELKAVRCDVCEKDLEAVPASVDGSYMKEYPLYFRVTTGHHDWGNDSCDSIEHLDVCPSCISGFVSGYLNEADSTQYIDIETKHVWPRDVQVTERDLRCSEYIFK